MKKFNGISKKTTINTFYDFCIRYFFIILLQKRSKKSIKKKAKNTLKDELKIHHSRNVFLLRFHYFIGG